MAIESSPEPAKHPARRLHDPEPAAAPTVPPDGPPTPAPRSLHGAETLFVEGEGIVSVQLDGTGGPDPLNTGEDRSRVQLLSARETPPFRFRRLGPRGRSPGVAVLEALARGMVAGDDLPEGTVPAGYTYLGQFIDHDLTMDVTQVGLGEDVSPADLLQARSPTLDLDSLYGAGPSHEGSADLYADGLHLKVGTTGVFQDLPEIVGHDLPRRGTGDDAEQRTAVVGDPRNDENLAVAQTHVAFIAFHNAVVDAQEADVRAMSNARRFRRARRRATMHYQWLVWHDYLPRICDPAVLDSVWADGRVLVDPAPQPFSMTAMPIEFSVAGFRLGHSMVRGAYNWNSRFPTGSGSLQLLFAFSAKGGTIFGLDRVPSNWVVDWRRLYDFTAGGAVGLEPPGGLNHALRIDTRVTNPLKDLPVSTFGGDAGTPEIAHNLAFRNLTRASMIDLATGQGMVRKLGELGAPVPALTDAEILVGDGGADLSGLTPGQKSRFADRTPLWFYLLREAELNGGRLSGVGARIVAETLHRAMEGSRTSLVREVATHGFEPTFGPRPGTFEMTDLLQLAFGSTAADLAPIG